MKLNNFSVEIIGGVERDGGYVELAHGQQYSIRLTNDKICQCDAEIEVDGKSAGMFRIGYLGSVTIERPANDKGRFTFYKIGTPEAKAAQLVKNDNLGLVTVRFKPESPRPLVSEPKPWRYYPYYDWDYWRPQSPYIPWYPYRTWYNNQLVGGYIRNDTANLCSLDAPSDTVNVSSRAGGTGLSGKSLQDFYSVDSVNYNESDVVTIHLRLIASNDTPHPLGVSTPVPPVVE